MQIYAKSAYFKGACTMIIFTKSIFYRNAYIKRSSIKIVYIKSISISCTGCL